MSQEEPEWIVNCTMQLREMKQYDVDGEEYTAIVGRAVDRVTGETLHVTVDPDGPRSMAASMFIREVRDFFRAGLEGGKDAQTKLYEVPEVSDE